MTEHAVAQSAPGWEALEFADRQGRHIADSSLVEIARTGVVDGVLGPPMVIRRQCQHAQQPTEPIVQRSPAEERAVPAIVLYHEDAYQKSRRGEREEQAE